MSEEELQRVRDLAQRFNSGQSNYQDAIMLATVAPKLLAEIDRLRAENEELQQLGAEE